MKILTIGIALPGRAYDNHSLINAPAFFDYDALVIDPVAVSATIEEVVAGGNSLRTGDGQLVANLSSSPLLLGLDQLLTSRREQTELLLRRGGMVVVVAAPDVAHAGVAGLPSWRRYSWLPEVDGGPWSHLLHPVFGQGCRPISGEHPFAAYAEHVRDRAAYRAFFAEGQSQLDPGTKHASSLHVFARSPGGAAIGVEFKPERGRIVFIPALRDAGTGAARARLAAVIADCIGGLAELQTVEEEPAWAAAYALPGLEQLEAAEAEAAQAGAEAGLALAAAQAARAATSDLRRLLWSDGRAFSAAAAAALASLGFDMSDDGGWLIKDSSGDVIVEAGASEDEAGMDLHYRLRQRREEVLAREGRMPRGLLVVGGQRETTPEERPQQYSESLRVAAESQRYCLLRGEDLLRIAGLALSRPPGDTLARLRGELLACEGVFDGAEAWSPSEVELSEAASESVE